MTNYFPLLLPLFAIAAVWIVESWGSIGSQMILSSGMDMESPSGGSMFRSSSAEGGRFKRATNQYQPEYPEYQEEYYPPPPPQPQYSYKPQYSYSYSPPKSYSYNPYPQSQYEDNSYSYKCTQYAPPDCKKRDDPTKVKCSCTEDNFQTGCFIQDCTDDKVGKGYVCRCNGQYAPKHCVQTMKCGSSNYEWFTGNQQQKPYSYSYDKHDNAKGEVETQTNEQIQEETKVDEVVEEQIMDKDQGGVPSIQDDILNDFIQQHSAYKPNSQNTETKLKPQATSNKEVDKRKEVAQSLLEKKEKILKNLG